MGTVASKEITPITHQRFRQWMGWPTAIISASVLTLAILNPLLCIVHCALAHRHSAVSADDPQLFLCQFTHSTQPAAVPSDQVWDGPRAIYDLTPFGTLSLMLIIISVPMIAISRALAPQHITEPSFPPPKIGLRPHLILL